MAWLKFLLVFWLVLALPAPVVAAIGKVVSVQQGAKVTTGGATRELRSGMAISSGDSIATDGNGVVQLIFFDDTKIAVGPNAQMVIDVTMLRGNRRAKNFAVQTLGGSFRFISGKSRKSSYTIKSPTSTMGVRGTALDIWVLDDRQSSVVVLDGEVRMCGLNGRCTNVSGQCSLVATSPRGGIGRPVNDWQAYKAVKNGFPFIVSQKHLTDPFRLASASCDELLYPPTRLEIKPAVPTKAMTFAPPSVKPAPVPPSELEPPTTGGFPGQSASAYGNNLGRGNQVSNTQHGSGTGKGQGVINRATKNRNGTSVAANGNL